MDKLLEDPTAAVAEFDASLVETNGGLLDHVTARVELEAAITEVIRLVEMLDGLNRYRFDREPQLLAAWETAKHVVTGPQPPEEVEGAPVTPTPAVLAQPVAGEVKPAA